MDITFLLWFDYGGYICGFLYSFRCMNVTYRFMVCDDHCIFFIDADI